MKLRSSIAPIPPGALDLAGEAVRRRRLLQRQMLERLEAAGYEEIIPPTFEYAEVFVRAGGAEVADKLIRFLDLDGQLLALRYDFTASAARLAATKLSDRATPLRVCYTGNVFRQEPGREGRRPREILQAGGELLGDGSVQADVEVVRLALDLIQRAGIKEFQVNLGHVGALAPALAALPPTDRAAVRRLIDRRDAAGLAIAATGALRTLPFVIGRRDAPGSAARVAPEARGRAAAPWARPRRPRRARRVRLGGCGPGYYTGTHPRCSLGAGAAFGAAGATTTPVARFGRALRGGLAPDPTPSPPSHDVTQRLCPRAACSTRHRLFQTRALTYRTWPRRTACWCRRGTDR